MLKTWRNRVKIKNRDWFSSITWGITILHWIFDVSIIIGNQCWGLWVIIHFRQLITFYRYYHDCCSYEIKSQNFLETMRNKGFLNFLHFSILKIYFPEYSCQLNPKNLFFNSIKFWPRYVDDILVICSSTDRQIQLFNTYLN